MYVMVEFLDQMSFTNMQHTKMFVIEIIRPNDWLGKYCRRNVRWQTRNCSIMLHMSRRNQAKNALINMTDCDYLLSPFDEHTDL